MTHRRSRFNNQQSILFNEPQVNDTSNLLHCTREERKVQTDDINLQSISSLIICLLLSASLNDAFQFILKLISARFPHAHILKMAPDFIKN